MDRYFNEDRLDNWETVAMLRAIFRTLYKLKIIKIDEYYDLDDKLPYYFDDDIMYLDDGPRYEDVTTEEDLTQERYDRLFEQEMKRRRRLSRKERPNGTW